MLYGRSQRAVLHAREKHKTLKRMTGSIETRYCGRFPACTGHCGARGSRACVRIKLGHVNSRKGFAMRYYGDIGIHGETVGMSANVTPRSTKAGTRDHLLFIALTSSGDFQVDANKHWQRARCARDSTGDYLFDPREVVRRGYSVVAKDLKKWEIVKRFPEKKAKAWYKICETFYTEFESDPKNLLIITTTIMHRRYFVN